MVHGSTTDGCGEQEGDAVLARVTRGQILVSIVSDGYKGDLGGRGSKYQNP